MTYRSLLASLLLLLASVSLPAQTRAPHALPQACSQFIENLGQITDLDGHQLPDVLYTASGRAMTVALRRTGLSYVFRSASPTLKDDSPLLHRLDMDLVGTSTECSVEGAERGGTTTYLSGGSRTVAAGFGEIIYRDVYPRVDLLVHAGSEQGIKYDFVVRPGGDLEAIRLRYTGASSVGLEEDGSLRVRTPLGDITEESPRCWTEDVGGKRREVAGAFIVEGDEVRFDVSHAEPGATLVIDPSVAWVTYFGGSSDDIVYDLAPTRWTAPGTPPANDSFVIAAGATVGTTIPGYTGSVGSGLTTSNLAFISKISRNTGAPVWTVVLRVSNPYLDFVYTATDTSGNIFLAGTCSGGLPTTSGSYQQTAAGGSAPYLAKFDSTGSLLWCTYYGGALMASTHGIAVDRGGDVVLYSVVTDSSLATPGAYQNNSAGRANLDPMVTRFSSTGALRWSTYCSSISVEPGYAYSDFGAVVIDRSGNIIITGETYGTGFPVTSGAFQRSHAGWTGIQPTSDGFLVKLNAAGTQMLWGTYIGGTEWEHPYGLAVDSANNILLVGTTSSINFPVTSGAQQTSHSDQTQVTSNPTYDGFAMMFDSAGSCRWSTYLGGAGQDDFRNVAVRGVGDITIVGTSNSTGFPISGNAPQTTAGGGSDAIIVKLDSTGHRTWSTYLGGSSAEICRPIIVGRSWFMIGGRGAASFPTTSNAAQRTLRGFTDGMLALYCDLPTMRVDESGRDTLCAGDSIILSAPTGYSYTWSTGATTRTIIARQTGSYWYTASNGECDARSDTTRLVVHPLPQPRLSPSGSRTICSDDSVTLDPGAWRSYRWNTGDTTRRITVRTAGLYSVRVVDSNGCIGTSDTFNLTVNQKPTATIAPGGALFLCPGDTVQLDGGATHSAWRWSTGETTRTIRVARAGRYRLAVRSVNGCWSDTVDATVTLYPRTVLRGTVTPPEVCAGDSGVLDVSGPYRSWNWSTGETTPRLTVRATGDYTVAVTDTNGCVVRQTLSFTVHPNPAPKLRALGPTTFCEGDSVVIDPGVWSGEYIWQDGSRTKQYAARTSGRYYVTVISPEGCVGHSDTLDVVVHPLPVLDLSGPIAVCGGSRKRYAVTGQPNVRYRWSLLGGTIVGDSTQAGIDVQWGAGPFGKLTLTAVDALTGCMNQTEQVINVGSSLKPLVRTSRLPVLCPGDSVELDAGDGYTRYGWNLDGTPVPGAAGRSIVVRSAGAYTVSVTDADGCSGTSDTIHVRLNAPPAPVISSSSGTSLCEGDSVVLSAGSYASYRWSTGEPTPTIIVRSAGSYTVEVTDSAGCVGISAPFELLLKSAPRPVIDGPNAVCINAVERYTVGDSIALPVTWSAVGGVVTAGQTTRTATVQWGAAGVGEVRAEATTDGCTRSERYPVTISTELHPHLDQAGVAALCRGDSLQLNAPSGYAQYRWNSGELTRSIVVRSAGEYWVEVASSGGCQGRSDTVLVVEASSPTPVIAAGSLSLCGGDSTVLDAGVGYARYQWSTGEASRMITAHGAGSYSVEVWNADGCRGATGIEITQEPTPQPVIVPANATLCEGDSVELDAGGGYGQYRWSTGETTQRIMVRSAGSYTVEVQSPGGGCWGTSPSVTVQVITPTVPVISQVGIELESTPALSYQWRAGGAPISGATAQRYQPSVVGDYTVTTTDANGCTATSAPYRYTGDVVAVARLEVGSSSADPGQAVEIRPVLANTTGLSEGMHYTLRLRYGRSLLAPGAGVSTTGIDRNEREVEVGGTLRSSVTGGNLELEPIPMTATLGRTESTALTPTSFTVTEAPRLVLDTVPGQFTLTGLCRNGGTRLVEVEGETVLKVWRPNPASERATVDYEMVESGRMRLVLIDARGREALVIAEGLQVEGRFRVDVDVRALPNGAYACILVTPSELRRQQVRVLR